MSLALRLNAWANVWWNGMVASQIATAVVLAIVSLIWLIVRRKASPQWGYLLFLLVPLKLLVPVEVQLPEAISRRLPWPAAEVASVKSVAAVEPVATAVSRPAMTEPRANRVADIAPGPGPILPSSGAAGPASLPSLPATSAMERAEVPPLIALAKTLSGRAWLMLAWGIVAAILGSRFLFAQWRFHRRLRAAVPASLPDSLVSVPELADLVGDRIGSPRVRLIESDAVRSPAVWGVFRPQIVLPRGIASALSSGELRWVLLHELAHIRRHDLLVNALQRVLLILNFANPALWIAEVMINRLREFACDDLASREHAGSSIERGEAFLGVVRWATASASRGNVPAAALGLFDLRGRQVCAARLRRLLESDGAAIPTLRRTSWLGLALLAAVCLPRLTAAPPSPASPSSSAPAQEKPAATERTPVDATKDVRRFRLAIVGPDARPVPRAEFELRIRPGLPAWTFHRGTFKKAGRYGTFATADDEGRAEFDLPATGVQDLQIFITTPGFGPFWAAWNTVERSDVVPESYTAPLEAGVRVGGIVVDEDGKPIAGVEVHPNLEFKKREGDLSQFGIGSVVKTDAEGRWIFASVPAARESVSVQLNHPEYLSDTDLSLPLKTFTVAAGEVATRPMTLPSGLAVTGRVTGRDGNPLAGARVRGEFRNAQREAITNEQGEYRLTGCRPGRYAIVCTAKEHGPDLRSVDLQPALAPVNFELPPGKTIRVRMVGPDGKPVPKFRVFFQGWRGDSHAYGLNQILAYANAEGVWEWREAPEDVVYADICPPAGMQIANQPLVARAEEYLFHAKPGLSVAGRVIAKGTGQPIPAFRVVPGVNFGQGDILWERRDSFDGRNGAFHFRTDSPRYAYRFRIEARGFQTIETRDIRPEEGAVGIDLELEPGAPVAGVVLTPEGQPAAKATIAIGLAGSQIRFWNGELTETGTYCDRRETDAEGRFEVPSQTGPFELIVIHPAGSAWIRPTPGERIESIQLVPWARAKGIVRVGTQPAAGVRMALNHSLNTHGQGPARVNLNYETVSDEEGRFAWDRILPGEGTVAKVIKHHVSPRSFSQSYSHGRRFSFPAGETVELQIGGTGRAVTGHFLPPTSVQAPVDWNFATLEMQVVGPLPPPLPALPKGIEGDPVKTQEWFDKFIQTPEGAAYLAAAQAAEEQQARALRVTAAIHRDGTFRIDDVPEGTYDLHVLLSSVPSDALAAGGPNLGRLQQKLTIPEMAGGRSDEPLDLGILELDPIKAQ